MASKTKGAGPLAVALTLALVLFGHPSNGWIVLICAILAMLLIAAFRDYPPKGDDSFKRFVRWVFLSASCALLSSGWGWFWWQRVTVGPSRVDFRGYPNETFSFSIKNGTSEDVYDVQIPFLIGYNKHLDDKFSAKVMPNGDPPQRIYDDYHYCYGIIGDGVISHVQPNEREVFIVRIRHLAPLSSGSFSITYSGGPEIKTQPGEPDFLAEPTSYSPNQTTVGVRGDYRICKYAINTDGMVGK